MWWASSLYRAYLSPIAGDSLPSDSGRSVFQLSEEMMALPCQQPLQDNPHPDHFRQTQRTDPLYITYCKSITLNYALHGMLRSHYTSSSLPSAHTADKKEKNDLYSVRNTDIKRSIHMPLKSISLGKRYLFRLQRYIIHAILQNIPDILYPANV